jgi:hypothetical protein
MTAHPYRKIAFANARAVALTLVLSCKKDAMAPIKNLETALLNGTTLPELPACSVASLPQCRDALARALGARTGFNAANPDQASSAAMAVMLVRDHRGELAEPESDAWLLVLRSGRGVGPDALRLATVKQLETVLPELAREWRGDVELRTFLKGVAAVSPGTCQTYRLVGEGAADASIPAQLHWRSSACVHHDLGKRDGLNVAYAPDPASRCSAGARAALFETVRALRAGTAQAAPAVKARMETKLASLEQLSEHVKLVLPDAERDGIQEHLGTVHSEVGIELWKRDAGADASKQDASRVSP